MDSVFTDIFESRAVGPLRTYSPEGELYDQIPKSLRGKLSAKAMLLLGAILDSCERVTPEGIEKRGATIARDKDLEADTGIHRRTIQRLLKFMESEAVKAIQRIPVGGRRITKIVYELAAGQPKPEPPSKPVKEKPEPKPQPPPPPVDLAYGIWAVGFAEGKGWRLIEEPPGKLVWVPIAGREQVEIRKNHKLAVEHPKNLPSVLAYIRSTHRKE